ncbi:hypothetical protein N7E81_07735 [Reichenbachiella carrageenanivorans]|uniref:Uncharacterized protein n=1 Tax=Reichenbachiella carrageenanivorans TaxID=2979869 RepID=A0ABY6D775_9BACT|nr:hypothetical protein [Reichenbachiella carrageenanivorans]UXX80988.1 hypothetical protein N7E81_07735 [Reichenbachiella carrageenanivorans]
MLVGLYRAEILAIVEDRPEYRWISWVDPKSPTIDFHVPTTFGKFIFAPN